MSLVINSELSKILCLHLPVMGIVLIVRSYSAWMGHFVNRTRRFAFVWQREELVEWFVTDLSSGAAYVWGSKWTNPNFDSGKPLWRAIVGHDFVAEGYAAWGMPEKLAIYSRHDQKKMCDVPPVPRVRLENEVCDLVGCENGLIATFGYRNKTVWHFDLLSQFWSHKTQLRISRGGSLLAANCSYTVFANHENIWVHDLIGDQSFQMTVCSNPNCHVYFPDCIGAFSSFDPSMYFSCCRSDSAALTVINLSERRVYFHECNPASSRNVLR
jgi:hypothetical protein